MKFLGHFNRVPSKGTAQRGKVQTIQDQALTIADLFKRLQGGIIPPSNGLQYAEDEDDVPIRIRDLADIDQIKDEFLEKSALIKEAKDKAEADRRQKELEDYYIERKSKEAPQAPEVATEA